MIILGVSTSSPRGSVALLRDDVLVGGVAYEGEMEHAERLVDAIDELLATASVDRHQLTALGCDIGPGSFTGVRVGLATCKGIAMGLGIPLLGVVSLEAMATAALAGLRKVAEAAPPDGLRIVCLVDAKRDETFLAEYDATLAPARGPEHMKNDQLPAALDALADATNVHVIGTPAHGLAHGPAPAPEAQQWPGTSMPDAEWVARHASARLAAGERPELAAIEPVYVRAPDALMPPPAVPLWER